MNVVKEAEALAALDVVTRVSKKVAAGRVLPMQLSSEDLASAAMLRLLKGGPSALKGRHLAYRARNAMFDELRTHDWTARKVRRCWVELQSAQMDISQEWGRPASLEEAAVRIDISPEYLLEVLQPRHISPKSLHEKMQPMEKPVELMATLEAGTPPDQELEAGERSYRLHQAIQALPSQERTVVVLYYYEHLTLTAIGKFFNLRESRVSQIHTKALGKLREQLQEAA